MDAMFEDVSPDFRYNALDAAIGRQILCYEATPAAILYFSQLENKLSDYAYWFFLGTLWVSYSKRSDLEKWKKLFSSGRPKRRSSLMKPSELKEFERLPSKLRVYRAHRKGEIDWISYTLDVSIAERFAKEYGVTEIHEYEIRKKYALALFLRRGEREIIMLDPRNANPIMTHKVSPRDGRQ